MRERPRPPNSEPGTLNPEPGTENPEPGTRNQEPGTRRAAAWRSWLLPLGVGAAIWLLPVPVGLTPNAWHYTALFAVVVAGLVAEPVPAPVMGFIGLSAAAVLRLVADTPADSVRWALSGFSNDVVWLIFSATIFALGYEVTGLGRRIALLLVRRLGRSTLGLGYAVALADLVLAPFMPSNTARSAGTIYPVVRSIPPLYGSTPAHHPRAIGAYLFWTAFATTCVTSSMFATAMAPNLLAMELARTIAHVDFGWTTWMVRALPFGVVLFLLTPVVTYLVYPPAIASAGAVVAWAGAELAAMGPLSRRELTMGVLAVLALTGWVAGSAIAAPVTVSLIVISLMVLTGVVSWADIVGHRQGWNVLIWFATLLTMADGLSRVGFLTWLADRSASGLGGYPVVVTAVLLIALFFVMHYFFASTTAHTTAVLPAFLAAVVAIPDMPVTPVVLTLVYSLGLMGVLTPYATGPAPVWASAGYIPTRDFWKLGALMGALYLLALLAIELPFLLYVSG
ncbi:MAG TPA: DASS family sodium-coupled anion symporter [Vicinamibacterales bacterium]|nr:DASS family sodium-coupled anion symporter [Vicinamibacterales bacterium]